MITHKNFAAMSGFKNLPMPAPGVPSPVKTQTVSQSHSIKMRRGHGDINHTPGPWYPSQNTAGTWEARIGSGTYDQTVLWGGGGCPAFFRGSQEANIKLAAAAPAMLECLQECLEILTYIPGKLDDADFDQIENQKNMIRGLIYESTGVEL